ncbi:MAG: T9SS type A sorting domain-containing protein, partial [candidate division KSB1 bacterium]|nr:T9SS type A sorting domain-containing protein [candidate division KSB1 bacterium]
QFFLDSGAEKIKYKFIRIYNILGQLVAVIDISHLGPGVHTIKFNGRDNWGRELPSGIYFCQLVVGETISTIRISFLK